MRHIQGTTPPTPPLPPRHISNNINATFGVPQVEAWKKLYTSGFETDFEYIRTLSYRGYKDNGTPNGATGLFVDMTNLNNTNTSVTVNGAYNITVTSNTFTNQITQTGTGATATTNIISACVPAVGEHNTLTYSRNETNNFLNVVPLLPNAVYTVDFITYRTDTEGRVRQIEATLDTIPRGRDELQQRQAKFFKNGANNAVDDGGHMIGSRFKGIVEQINYFPQELNTNRSGDWKSVEDEWERIAKGRPAVIRNGVTTPAIPPQTVRVDIRPQFQGNRRPNEFIVDFWYNNVQQVQRTVTNP